MSDNLDPDVQQLVNLAKKARTPGAKDQLRLAERLAVPLAASAALGTAVGAAKAAGIEAASVGAKAASGTLLGSLGAKLAAVAVVGVAATALFVSQHASKPSAAPAPSRQIMSAVPALSTVVPAAEASAVEPAPVDSVAEPEPSEPKAAPKPSSSVHSVKHADELTEEASLLHEAQSAWRAGQSALALKLANQHAQRFPHSQLANERDVLRVLSLCKLGQTGAAKQVGARLLKTAKGSPWYQSVADSCAAN